MTFPTKTAGHTFQSEIIRYGYFFIFSLSLGIAFLATTATRSLGSMKGIPAECRYGDKALFGCFVGPPSSAPHPAPYGTPCLRRGISASQYAEYYRQGNCQDEVLRIRKFHDYGRFGPITCEAEIRNSTLLVCF